MDERVHVRHPSNISMQHNERLRKHFGSELGIQKDIQQ